MGWVFVLALIVYAAIGFRLSAKAARFLKEPQKVYTSSTLVRPELYVPDGQAARAAALRFWWAGGAIVAAIAIAASLLK